VPGTFENASLKLTVNANSLAVINDLKEKDRHEIEQTMRNDVLETGNYPEIVFQSNNVSLSRLREGIYRARVIGNLTLHGVTQNNIWISGEVTLGPDELRVKGEFPLKQTDYKIKLVSVAGGTLKIKNEVKCSFDLVARTG
jgi:polyisoprenoid-binding protein YceI